MPNWSRFLFDLLIAIGFALLCGAIVSAISPPLWSGLIITVICSSWLGYHLGSQE